MNYQDSDIDVIDIVGAQPRISNRSEEVEEEEARKRTLAYPQETIVTEAPEGSNHKTVVTYEGLFLFL